MEDAWTVEIPGRIVEAIDELERDGCKHASECRNGRKCGHADHLFELNLSSYIGERMVALRRTATREALLAGLREAAKS